MLKIKKSFHFLCCSVEQEGLLSPRFYFHNSISNFALKTFFLVFAASVLKFGGLHNHLQFLGGIKDVLLADP